MSGTLNARPQRLEVEYSNVEILENMWPYRTIFLCRNEAIPILCWAHPTSTDLTVDARSQASIEALRKRCSLTPWKNLETAPLFIKKSSYGDVYRGFRGFHSSYNSHLPWAQQVTWSYISWAIHCVHMRKNWDISNSSLSLQNTLPLTSESCAFTCALITVASQLLYFVAFCSLSFGILNRRLISIYSWTSPNFPFLMAALSGLSNHRDVSVVRELCKWADIAGSRADWSAWLTLSQNWVCWWRSESTVSIKIPHSEWEKKELQWVTMGSMAKTLPGVTSLITPIEDLTN